MIYDVIIAGGGASGLFCACGIKEVSGLILEGTSSPGNKLLISGGGMCNLTHAGSVKDFIPCYFESGSKIRRCLYKHSNVKMADFFRDLNLPLYSRGDGKVFPKSESSLDVLNALVSRARRNGFNILTSRKVTEIKPVKEHLYEVNAGDEAFLCRNMIIACGGSSFPKTGSDGSILTVLARNLPGLSDKTVTPKPALAPVYVADYPYGSLSGVSFPEAALTACSPDGRTLASVSGPLLFAESFLTGPAVLHISRYLDPGFRLIINYLPGHDLTKKDMNSLLSESRRSPANTAAERFGLPKSFAQLLERDSMGRISAFSGRLLSDSFTVEKVGGFASAMATRGGVSLDAVSTSTFEAVSHPGLFVIGETLDVDGMTGGYNLQFAFSSAMAAADKVNASLHSLSSE